MAAPSRIPDIRERGCLLARYGDSWRQGGWSMSRLFWFTEGQIERIAPFFLKSLGVDRADDRKVLSGIL